MSDAVRPAALTLVDFRARPVRQPLTQRSRGQRNLQLTVAAGDLVIVGLATTLAAAGRTRLTVFDDATGVNVIALSIGGYVIVGWMLMNLLVGSYDSSLHCVDAATGKAVWTHSTDNYINGTPALLPSGEIVFGGCDSFIHVLQLADGKELRQIESEAYIASSVAVMDAMERD